MQNPRKPGYSAGGSSSGSAAVVAASEVDMAIGGDQGGSIRIPAPRMEIIERAFEMLPNTAPFDVTGHPSMSVPCGLSDGLPVGMMLTAKHFDEVSIYRAASAFEKAGDWTGIRP